jgi:hypothetical protein
MKQLYFNNELNPMLLIVINGLGLGIETPSFQSGASVLFWGLDEPNSSRELCHSERRHL